MAGSRADEVTRRYRLRQEGLARQVLRLVLALVRRPDMSDVDGWWARVGPQVLSQVEHGWLQTRATAARYLVDHAVASGLPRGAVEPALATWQPRAAATSLRVTGPVAWKTGRGAGLADTQATKVMQTRLLGSAQRLVLTGGRDTVAESVRRNDEIVGWRRVHVPNAKNPQPCYFCAMLISRGSVYKSGKSAGDTRYGGEDYHDHDLCQAEPLYEEQDEPGYVTDLQDQWEKATAGHSGKAAVRAWRQYWELRTHQGGEAQRG